jgi:hypothetical protein
MHPTVHPLARPYIVASRLLLRLELPDGTSAELECLHPAKLTAALTPPRYAYDIYPVDLVNPVEITAPSWSDPYECEVSFIVPQGGPSRLSTSENKEYRCSCEASDRLEEAIRFIRQMLYEAGERVPSGDAIREWLKGKT